MREIAKDVYIKVEDIEEDLGDTNYYEERRNYLCRG